MQPLTAPPRDGFTDEQILNLLTAASWVSYDAGLELLDASLNVVGDISGQLDPADSSITWSAGDTWSRPAAQATPASASATLAITGDLGWGVDLVRPYMMVGDGTITARFNLGVYCLTAPQRPVGETDENGDTLHAWTAQGFDRTYLLDRPVGDAIGFSAGANISDAIIDTLTGAGITGWQLDVPQTAVLSADLSWSLSDQVTWLTVVNQMLAAAACVPLWCDENGQYRSQLWVDPAARIAEFTVNTTGGTAITGNDRTFTGDVWAQPNVWIFLQEGYNGTPSEGSGQYTVVNQSNGPLSIDARGLRWPVVVSLTAADQTTLQTLGDAYVAAATRDTATIQATTAPLPIAGVDDVLTLNDPDAAGITKVLATDWTLPLNGSDMSWAWQAAA